MLMLQHHRALRVLLLTYLVVWLPLAAMAQGRAHIYEGNSSYMGDILYSYDGKYLYRGNSSYVGDILYTTDAPMPWPVLLSVAAPW